MRILISRSHNDYDEYDVPVQAGTTVMDILDYIYDNLDSSLAYYRHSRCNQGICGRCAVKVDGKTVLACTAVVDYEKNNITLDPAGNNIIRDLVVLSKAIGEKN